MYIHASYQEDATVPGHLRVHNCHFHLAPLYGVNIPESNWYSTNDSETELYIPGMNPLMHACTCVSAAVCGACAALLAPFLAHVCLGLGHALSSSSHVGAWGVAR